MRIYLAASRREIDLAREFMKRLRGLDYRITHDWIADIDRNGPNDADVAHDEVVRCARNDLDGVESADLFWLMCPKESGSGCFVELGAAITLGKDIVISGAIDRTIFATLAKSQHGAELHRDHESAFQYITQDWDA